MDVTNDFELTLDLVSSGMFIIKAQEVAVIDIPTTDFRLMTGLEYFRYLGNPSDTATFQIVYNGQVVRQLATDILMKDGHWRLEAYRAKLNPGATIRLIYKNNGQSECQFGFNLIRHAGR